MSVCQCVAFLNIHMSPKIWTQFAGPAVMLSAVVSAALSGVHAQQLRSSGKGKAETALVYTWIL